MAYGNRYSKGKSKYNYNKPKHKKEFNKTSNNKHKRNNTPVNESGGGGVRF